MALSLNAWKGLSMGVFTLISIIGAAIAVIMKERAKQVYICCGVLFSAGVLLAAGFVHLLNDSNEDFVDLEIENFPWAFSIAGMTVTCLMCMEMILDRVIGDYINKKRTKKEEEVIAATSHAVDNTPSGHYVPPVAETSQESTTEHPEEEQEKKEQDESTEKELKVDHHDDHTHLHISEGDNPFSAVILTLALSVHSIIEGLGLGATLEVSEIQSAFVAIAVHKGFTAFALAQGMINAGYWRKGKTHKIFYLSLGTFILVANLGIAIGWGVSTIGDGVSIAVLIGITSGSFIYVAMIELLPQEMECVKRERLPLIPVILSFLAGYMLMTMLAIWV